jgi:uncharacterized protein YukE
MTETIKNKSKSMAQEAELKSALEALQRILETIENQINNVEDICPKQS